ncbi:hypothetical protein E3T46_03510 [Cryobacterium sp. Hh11]|uniref:hypothetical protein n=1 Tax=Cryobacterium sp. Hh11 TaxID=2555868 RepID=UPI0010697550|nr:hypothetical protein [Cryobacterium sp. Hh11]TFD53395.1 hypothetical protein E3T46_03510 [Cryobacterium sp. Hh11]
MRRYDEQMGVQRKMRSFVRTGSVLLLAFALTRCAAEQAEPIASDAPTASQAPSAAAEAAEPVAETPECATALAAAAYSDFESSGLELREYQGWRTDIQFMADDGGITCTWQGQGDVVVIFGQLALTAAEWESRKAELNATGYLKEATPGEGYFNEPDTDPNYVDGGFVYRDGNLFYVSYPALTQWVPALVGT